MSPLYPCGSWSNESSRLKLRPGRPDGRGKQISTGHAQVFATIALRPASDSQPLRQLRRPREWPSGVWVTVPANVSPNISQSLPFPRTILTSALNDAFGIAHVAYAGTKKISDREPISICNNGGREGKVAQIRTKPFFRCPTKSPKDYTSFRWCATGWSTS